MILILSIMTIVILLITLGALGVLLLNEDGSTPQVAIVTEKFEAQGMHFIKVVAPVDEDIYVGLDVGDEVTLENE